jgi:hypothetical protein
MNQAAILEWLQQLHPIGVALVIGFVPALIARWKRRPLRRPFPFSTNPFQLVLEECSYLQRLTSFPSSMTKRRQKFRGTKLAQSGTKS